MGVQWIYIYSVLEGLAFQPFFDLVLAIVIHIHGLHTKIMYVLHLHAGISDTVL